MARPVLLALSTIFRVRGGIPRFNQMLCLGLDELAPKLDLDVTVLSQDDRQEDYEAAGSPWKHLRFEAGHGQRGLVWRAFRHAVRTRPHCLIVGIVGMTPLAMPCLPFLRRGFGFIGHGWECWDDADLPGPKPSRRFTGRRASFALAVSTYTRDQLPRTIGIPADRILIQPNTLAPGFLAEPEPTDEDPDRQALITVSRLWADTKKGVDHSIEAFARLATEFPRATFNVVGGGTDRPRLIELAARRGVADRVVFEENLTDEELAERYRRSDLFVLPSGQEGFGIVYLEAMRFGRCCIGGQEGGVPDVIEHGRNGLLVPYGDVDALTTAMRTLLEDPDRRLEMGRAGRERLMERFIFPRFVDRLESNLRHILGDPPGER